MPAMTIWIQKGYAVISDVVADEGMPPAPFLHSFSPALWDANQAIKKASEHPDHLRRNIRIVEGELSFDEAKSVTAL